MTNENKTAREYLKQKGLKDFDLELGSGYVISANKVEQMLQEFSAQQNKERDKMIAELHNETVTLSTYLSQSKELLEEQKIKIILFDELNAKLINYQDLLKEKNNEIDELKAKYNKLFFETPQDFIKANIELKQENDSLQSDLTSARKEVEELKENKKECLALVESIEKLVEEERKLKQRYENKVDSKSKEIEELKGEKEKLMEGIKKALLIRDLWSYPKNLSEHHDDAFAGEYIALHDMESSFTALLETKSSTESGEGGEKTCKELNNHIPITKGKEVYCQRCNERLF